MQLPFWVCKLRLLLWFIYIDSDVSMKSHVANTVSVCFAILHQVQSIRQSGPRAVFQSLVMSHIVSWLDYGNATISPSLVPAHRSSIQSMMKCASQLVFSPWGMTAALRPFTNFIGWMQLRRLTTSLLSWSTSVDRELYRRTLQMFCLVIVSSYLLYTIINRWWPRFVDCWFVSGTVYRSTSHLCSHCQSSTVALRHISSGAASRDYFVVSEKWHCHIRAH